MSRLWSQLLLLACLSICLAVRLPDSVRPDIYRIYLRPDFEADCSFSGRVDITLTALNETDEIILHSKQLKIDEESVSFFELSGQKENDITRMPRDGLDNITVSEGQGESRNLLRIGLPRTLEKGGRYLLSIAYNGTMNKVKSVGIYCRQYRQGNQTKWLMSGSFEPYLARSAFPCFDEPGFKANFSLKLGHPSDYTALSNMPAIGVQPLEDQPDWSVTEFETTPSMSTYLIGFMVSQYQSRSLRLSDDRPLTVWASNEQKLQAADLALLYGRKHYQYFLDYFKVKDPMPKIDFLAIRHYQAGGLENWGIISFEERLLLLDSMSRSRRGNRLRTSNLIAHEMAHIWFGNLVTPRYWDDIWLNEGFSSYFASLATDSLFPNYGYKVQSFVLARLAAMTADCLPTTHPLKVDAASHPTGDLFDEITYHKGELIVRMVSILFGEDKLKSALRQYLQKHLYGLASEKDLWDELEKQLPSGYLPAGVTLAEVMDSWISRSGYPVLIVTRNYTTGQVTVSQTSVLDRDNGRWWIPVSYTTSKERNFTATPKFWLSPSSGNYTFNTSATADDWILFNTRAAGYYSSRYDMINSLLLAQDLDQMPLLERIQVLGDILQLGYLGQAPIELSLDFVLRFKAEMSPLPWFALLESVPKYMALFKGSEGEEGFVNLFRNVLEPEFDKLTKDSPHNKQMFKVSCSVGVDNCTQMALKMFEQWKLNSTKVPEEIRYQVLCTAVEQGNASTWHFLEEKYHSLKDGCKEKKDILKALSCTKDKELINKYVSWALEGNTSKKASKKTDTMLKAIAEKNPSLLLSSFSKQSPLPRISKSMKWKRILEKVALNVYTEDQLNQLKSLVEESREKLKSADGAEQNKIIDIAARNVKWVKGNQNKALEWLNKLKANEKAKST